MRAARPAAAVQPRSMRRSLASLVLAWSTACSSGPWDEEVSRPRAVDLDPDPRTVEITLTARPTTLEILPGRPTALWGFDGLVPGPHVEANVGDRLVVHFRNELPVETTVHWHGIRVPNEMDGVPEHTQPPVPPGGTFEYAFDLPDEGLYWFHPHVRSNEQVAAGLYGTILVRAPDEPEVPELVLVLSDVAVDETGALRPPDTGGTAGSLFGREGDVILVNGRVRPTVRVRPGQLVRLRFVNAAISRYMQLRLGSETFRIIGGDRGILPLAHEEELLLVLPGQRVDALVTPTGPSGSTLPLEWVPYDRGYGSTEFRDPTPILDFALEGTRAPPTPVTVPRRSLDRLSLDGATPIESTIRAGTIGGRDAFLFDGVPGWPDAPLPARVGETQVFHFVNTTSWSHPIHLHGFFFQRVVDGRADGIWRDTLDVPHGASGDYGEATFAVTYEDRPGMWMFHCHILDHSDDLGMMGMIALEHVH